jgi:hypothetical protein
MTNDLRTMTMYPLGGIHAGRGAARSLRASAVEAENRRAAPKNSLAAAQIL